MAAWMPVTVVPTSTATAAIDTFITDVSRVMRSWADASVSSTIPAAAPTRVPVSATSPPDHPWTSLDRRMAPVRRLP
jgi:hypothetical protein